MNITEITFQDEIIESTTLEQAPSLTVIDMTARGRDGLNGEAAPARLLAGTNLIAFKLITSDGMGDAIYASADNVNHINSVIGVALNSASTGANVDIKESSIVENGGWSWTPNQALYLGLNGDIVTTQVGLFSVCIGYAVSATKVFLNIQRGILRS